MLFERRERWGLTWPGMLLLVALIVISGRWLCAFLAVTEPVGAPLLVVESWMPAFAFRDAVARFNEGGYEKIIAAGVYDDDWNEPGGMSECFGDKNLVRFGAPAERVVTATAERVSRDRTFHAAMAVKRWLQQQGRQDAAIDVITIGPHARRSRLLFEKALGENVRVGVIAVPERRYDMDHWWRSSAGFRMVTGEAIAYAYTRLFSWRIE